MSSPAIQKTIVDGTSVAMRESGELYIPPDIHLTGTTIIDGISAGGMIVSSGGYIRVYDEINGKIYKIICENGILKTVEN